MSEVLAELPLELSCVDTVDMRQAAIADSARFGSVYTHEGETHSYAHQLPSAIAAQEQLELELPGYTKHETIRHRLADKIEFEVLPIATSADKLEEYPFRLRSARQHADWGIRLNTGKHIAYWDTKAGLARLCPDDAREEAMRLRRRLMPKATELMEAGHRFLYAVFTVPNSEAGKLRDGMASIFEKFKRRVLEAKDKDGAKLFPGIKGALAVLEAPLGRSRDWNVHLNVLMPVKGFLDWKALRAAWYWNAEFKWLPMRSVEAFQAAFAEVVKYPVVAMATKSQRKQDTGETAAPAMLDWKAPELLEWLRAMRGFRRTRTYGALYRLAKPDRVDVGPILWVGTITACAGRWLVRCALLGSITEDKSRGAASALERYQALFRSLAPGGVAGAGHLGSSLRKIALP